MLRKVVRSALEKLGFHVYRNRSLPSGVNWLLDVSRLRALPDDPVVFDVGANIGQTVLELKRWLPRSSIIAFEPFSKPFETLRSVAVRVGGVLPVRLALGSKQASVQIPPRKESVLNSLVARADGECEGAPEEIHVDTVDNYCERERLTSIDILKTDTEGFDLEVLKGAAGMLRSGRIMFVYSEVTFCSRNRQNTPFPAIHSYLSELGYELLGLYETYSLHHFAEPNLFCNALYVNREVRNRAMAKKALSIE